MARPPQSFFCLVTTMASLDGACAPLSTDAARAVTQEGTESETSGESASRDSEKPMPLRMVDY